MGPNRPGSEQVAPEPAPDLHEKRLDRQWNRLRGELPQSTARQLGWLRERKARLVRIPTGLLLIIGGFLGFLPIFGFWMVPLGLLLLAQDVPFMKRPAGRALVWFNRTWQRWKRWWRGSGDATRRQGENGDGER